MTKILRAIGALQRHIAHQRVCDVTCVSCRRLSRLLTRRLHAELVSAPMTLEQLRSACRQYEKNPARKKRLSALVDKNVGK